MPARSERASFSSLRDLDYQINYGLVRFSVLRRKARNDVAEIRFVELRICVDFAGEEAFPQRTEGNKSDAEFLERRHHFRFRLSPPQRVFALQRGDGLNGVRATDRLHARFRKAEVLHLALLDQILHRSGDIFDRHVRIDAVLIEEVDDVGLQPLERSFGDFLDVLGPAVQPGHACRSSDQA